MSVRIWTESVPSDYPYDRLVSDAGFINPKGIVKNSTPLGTGVGVDDAATSSGLLAFRSSNKVDGEYIIYYWRKA